MKKIAILILVFSFLIPTNCKKQTEPKAEEPVEEEELVQLEGYREAKWGMSKDEVEKILIQRGLKRKSGLVGMDDKMYEFGVGDREINHFDQFLDNFAIVDYVFKENKLIMVWIVFPDVGFYPIEKREEFFLAIKDMTNDKYKNIIDKDYNSVSWETSGTLIRLTIEKQRLEQELIEQISIYYMPKEEIMEKAEKAVLERLKSIIETKKKF